MNAVPIPVQVTLRYEGRDYTYTHDFPRTSEEWTRQLHDIEDFYTEGNFGCDCNRSDFIRQWCDEDFPELECGETIELIELAVQVPIIGFLTGLNQEARRE